MQLVINIFKPAVRGEQLNLWELKDLETIWQLIIIPLWTVNSKNWPVLTMAVKFLAVRRLTVKPIETLVKSQKLKNQA